MLDEYLRQLNSRPPLAPEAERELWRSYKATGDPEARCRLIEGYQVLVVRIGLALGAKPENAMDLIQEGTIGLLEAAEAFDPGRSVPFSSFAQHRIRGRMLDYFQRQKALAGELPLEEAGWGELAAVAGPAGAEADPAHAAEASEVRRRLRGAVARLPRQERRVVSAVFLEDQEPRRVAEELSITPSYLLRLEKRAIRRLRGMLGRVAGELRSRW